MDGFDHGTNAIYGIPYALLENVLDQHDWQGPQSV
jgi:hypothetical protein